MATQDNQMSKEDEAVEAALAFANARPFELQAAREHCRVAVREMSPDGRSITGWIVEIVPSTPPDPNRNVIGLWVHLTIYPDPDRSVADDDYGLLVLGSGGPQRVLKDY